MKLPLAFASLLLAVSLSAQPATLPNVTYQPSEVFNLWPGAAPGEKGDIGPEHVLQGRPRPFDQLADISVPTLAVFPAPAETRNGTAILVIPGGGLERLAIETEGYEVAEWLNAHGITAFMLKYRVPPRDPQQRWKVGLQDAQRAMSLIRSRAAEWHIDPDALGTIGFSAGGEINVMLAVYQGSNDRQYAAVDAADTFSTRPDFNIVMYGGGFADFRTNALRPDIASRLDKNAPPMFIAHAYDDAAFSSLILAGALKRAGVPAELHVFRAGAHGFGVRESGLPVAHWRELCLDWLAGQGFLDSAAVRAYAKSYLASYDSGAAKLPRFGAGERPVSIDDAFAAQQRLVRHALAGGDTIAGYKGAFTSAAAQRSFGIDQPLHGVLLKSGGLEAAATHTLAVDPQRPLIVETEIGYVIAVDIGTKLRVPRQAVTTVEAVVPVIELPINTGALMDGHASAADLVATNVGSYRYLVGAPVAPEKAGNFDAIHVSLQRDGQTLHESTGADVKGGQAENLMALINQIIDEGHVLHRGDIILCGALGGGKPGAKGRYVADYGSLGKIEFTLE